MSVDLSSLSDADLAAIQSGDMSKVSDDGLAVLSGHPAVKAALPQYSQGEAALQGFGDPVGYLPQMQAGLGAGLDKILPKSMGGGDEQNKTDPKTGVTDSNYDTLLKYYQGRNKNIEDQHPFISGLSKLASNVALSPLIPGANVGSGALTASGRILPAAGSIMGRVAQAAIPAAVIGGMQNVDENGDQNLTPEQQLLARLKNAGTSAATAGVIHGALEGLAPAGKSLYKSGFKKVDEALTQGGKTPISDVFLENGAPSGTTKTLDAANDELLAQKTAERQAMYDKVNATKNIDLNEAGTPRADKVLARMRRNNNYKDEADAFQTYSDNLKAHGPVPVDQMSEWKSDISNSLPSSAFNPDGSVRGNWQKFSKALASDLRDHIVAAGNDVEPGLGDKIDKVNDEMGSMIQAQKPLTKQIARGNTVNAVTSVDLPMAVLAPQALAAKKLADLSKTTAFRTMAGKALMKIPAPPPATTGAVSALAGAVSPWLKMGSNNSQ
jgi:hypothetical protein